MSPRNASVNKAMRDSAQRRILDAAHGLFRSGGYRRTTMAGIAAAAGVSVGLPMYYFGSKQNLLHALVDRLLHRTVVRRVSALRAGYADEQRLAVLIDALLEVAAREPEIIAQHLALLLQPEAGDLFQAPHEMELDRLIREVLTQRGGDLDTEDALLRSAVMGANYSIVAPYRAVPLGLARARIFAEYGLDPRAGSLDEPSLRRLERRLALRAAAIRAPHAGR